MVIIVLSGCSFSGLITSIAVVPQQRLDGNISNPCKVWLSHEYLARGGYIYRIYIYIYIYIA
jgi:hypothetical protein